MLPSAAVERRAAQDANARIFIGVKAREQLCENGVAVSQIEFGQKTGDALIEYVPQVV